MEKINRKQAKALYEMGAEIILCPSKCYPELNRTFGMACPISTAGRHPDEIETFDAVVNSFWYYNCMEETGLRVSYWVREVREIRVEFCGDNCQYFRPGVADGYQRPMVGAGSNEAEAFADAVDQMHCMYDNAPKLRRRGSARRGMAHYFGKDVAREHRNADDSDLYIYCQIFLPA